MNHDRLRALFQDALADEPADTGLVDDDVARGRALRTRRLRRRAGGVGVGAVALMAATLAVPASPLSLINDDDGGSQAQPATSSNTDAPPGPDGEDNPIRREMWDAVKGALPDGVEFTDGFAESSGGKHGDRTLGVTLQGADEANLVDMEISLAPARPDLGEFRPCSDPPSDAWQDAETCEEGRDDDGRWRVMKTGNPDYQDMAILEDDATSVYITWSEDDDPAGPEPPVLAEEHVDAIADAVFAVGAQHEPAELTAGIDLTETFKAWPELRAALEKELGLGRLSPMAPDRALPDGATYDPETGVTSMIDEQWQSGTIAARYLDVNGNQLDLVVWQLARPYDDACEYGLSECGTPPGYEALKAGDGSGYVFATPSGFDIAMETEPDPSDTYADDEGAAEEIAKLIRFQGGYRDQPSE